MNIYHTYPSSFLKLFIIISFIAPAYKCVLWPYSDFYKAEEPSFEYDRTKNTLNCHEPLKFIGYSKSGFLYLNNPNYEPMDVGGLLEDESLYYVLPDEVKTIHRGDGGKITTETCTKLVLKQIDPFKTGRIMDADEIIYGNLFCKIEEGSESLEVFRGSSYIRTLFDNLYLNLCSAWEWFSGKAKSFYP